MTGNVAVLDRGNGKPQSTYEECVESLAHLDDIAVMNNQVLVAIWMRPEKTRGGIILTDKTLDEDKYQGKVGFVLKKGPLAFVSDDRNDFRGQDVAEGDCILYRASDGFAVDVNGVHCRFLEDVHIRAKVREPSVIY